MDTEDRQYWTFLPRYGHPKGQGGPRDSLVGHTPQSLSTKSQAPKAEFFFFFFLVFLGPHPQHMEVPRLGVESEL